MKPPSAKTLAKQRTEKQAAQLGRIHTPEHLAALQLGRDKYNRAQLEARSEKIANGLFRCAKCHTDKTASEYPGSRKNKHGEPRYRYCTPCHQDYQRTNRLRARYSLTWDDYNKISEFQRGVCAVCEKPPKKKRLAVDHDHKTGLIRGLLCTWCNRALGQFRDDMERVNRTMRYFASPPCTAALGAERYGQKGRVDNKAETRRRLNRSAA